MKSPLSCPCLISYADVLNHLPSKHLRCSISLLLVSSIAILHKAFRCPAHWGCSGWLTSQEQQRAIMQPRQCTTRALDGEDRAVNTKNKQNSQRRRGFHSALSLFQLHYIWMSGMSKTESSSLESYLPQLYVVKVQTCEVPFTCPHWKAIKWINLLYQAWTRKTLS